MWTRPEVEALYRKTSFAIFQRCRSLLREDAEAKDVAQEVYMHLLAHPEEFRGEASPSTYLYAIATNKSLSRLRAEIADVMKLSRVTVNQRLQRFRDQAKEIAEREP